MLEMLEQLKTVRFMLSLVSGTFKLDELRKQVIEQVECTDENGKPMKYKDLSPEDKAQCDEAVAGFQELGGVFNDIVKAKARMTKSFFDALQEEGFTKEEALAITAAQPLEFKS